MAQLCDLAVTVTGNMCVRDFRTTCFTTDAYPIRCETGQAASAPAEYSVMCRRFVATFRREGVEYFRRPSLRKTEVSVCVCKAKRNYFAV